MSQLAVFISSGYAQLEESVQKAKTLRWSFWCNRTDSCDNDGQVEDCACQPKKSIDDYCEDSVECLDVNGFVCKSNKCDCPNADTHYYSALDAMCHAKQSINGTCSSDIECLSTKSLTCQVGVCQCPDSTYYFSTANNTCQVKNTYQESCVNNDGCRSDLGLLCSPLSVCDCVDSSVRWANSSCGWFETDH